MYVVITKSVQDNAVVYTRVLLYCTLQVVPGSCFEEEFFGIAPDLGVILMFVE